MKRFQFLTLGIGAVLLLGACGPRNDSSRWTEDVRFPDGRIVTLTRYQEFKGPHELGESPTVSNYWFEFTNPDTGVVVRLESNRDLSTLALMMDRGTPVLLVQPNFGGIFRRNCPNPPYLLYRFASDGSWKEEGIEKIPVKRLRVNMTFSPDDRQSQIRAMGNRLTVTQTEDSERNHMPYVIDFGLMGQQTFKLENCGKPFDLLIGK